MRPTGCPNLPSSPSLCSLCSQETERNVFDQHALSPAQLKTQFTTFQSSVLPLSTSDRYIPAQTPPRPLFYHPPSLSGSTFEVTTVYRSTIHQMSTKQAVTGWPELIWSAPAAIKCPTVLNQLSGCKKVQQVLAEPDRTRSSLKLLKGIDTALVERARGTPAPQYDPSVNSKGRDRPQSRYSPQPCSNHSVKGQQCLQIHSRLRDRCPRLIERLCF